ncbi:basic proline-rich protein-like isoform X3 [Penaeus chinensis]|uniref:basic proline-rich protein-like isoform X3 n=1 Tax=Penaeus chinensis TaxID=139456 RepID=UPI001FB61CCD|nr:basic proline-rich protein-like isoform X3 [Penaeus chinensis]
MLATPAAASKLPPPATAPVLDPAVPAVKPAAPSVSAAKSAAPSASAVKSETPAPVTSKGATSIPEATPSTSTSAASKPASPAPPVNKPASPVPPANLPASLAPAVSKRASPAPAVNQAASAPASHLATLAPAASKPASPAVKDPAGPSLAPPAAAKSSSPQPGPSVSRPSPSADSRAPASARNEPVGSKAGTPPRPPPPAPLVLPELSSARSPTPPLPPKQTAAEIISAPALPQAPKPAVTSATPPISAGTAAPTPLRLPSPSVPSAPERSVATTSAATPPSAPSATASEAKSAAPPTAPEAKSMSVVAPPPPATAPLIPAPPPEPERKVKTPEPPPATAKPSEAGQEAPRPSRAPDTSVPPQPEFPPPPPLEKDEAPGEPALPPPPGFFQEDRIKPPTSILPSIQDEDERGEEADDLPSPEYVRQSVSNRIMAFERHSSRDEDSPPRERPAASGPVRPVAPWVKRTSSGPVQQAGYWDMTSPEDQPDDAWPDPPRPPHEPEATKAPARPVASTKIPAAPSPPPAPASSAPAAAPAAAPPSSGKVLQPQEPSPAARVTASPRAKVIGPPPRPAVERKRSTSLGDYHAHYITPDAEPRRGARMPADGTPAVSPPLAQPTTPPKEKDDPLFDPWCDPKNPKVINFQDVSAAAFKIKSGIMNTPCTRSHMSSITDIEIYFKKEFNQFTGSFKERGARYTLLMLDESQRKKGVIAASAGNHALALSYHGQDLGIPVTVVMPLVAPIMKVQACRQYGANIIVKGSDIGECREIALKMAKEQDLLYINGYDHPHILAGQGTMGLEIVEQVPNIDAVVIPVGGGGLIAGVALAVKALHPHVQVIGVEAERCASFSAALKAGHPVYVKAESTLADGLAVPKVGVNAYATAAPLVDKVVTVREEWIAISILRLVEHEKAVVEGAGATALAAVLAGELPELKGKRVVIPLCGGNIDTTILGRCLERGLAADGRLVKFTVTVSDRPGGIAELTRLLANLGVSIKDMLHERAWIKNDIFSVEVKVMAETRDYEHYLELRAALYSRYQHVRFANADQIHD